MGKPSSNSRSELLSKADRKFEKKVQFYAKVRDTVAVFSAKNVICKKKKLRSRQKKLKTYDLSSLSEFLPDFKAAQQPTSAAEFKLKCKSRKKLILMEGKQLNTVLNHPVFWSDPFAAIRQHLESTQPVIDEKPKKKTSKNGSKKKTRKRSTSSGPKSMVF